MMGPPRRPPLPVAPLTRVSRAWLALVERLGQDQLPTSLMWAGIAGVLGALATVAFREAVGFFVFVLTGAQAGLVEQAAHLSSLHRVLLPALGGIVAGAVLWWERRQYGRDAGGDYMESITIGTGKIGFRSTLLRSLSSLMSVSSGGSIGREGAMVQLAAMLASLLSRSGMRTLPSRRLLVACGAAAGIASAYNTPISGALFVAEIVLGSIAMESFGPLLVASVVANLTTHHFLGYAPLYRTPAFAAVDGLRNLQFVALGILVALLAPLFLRLINGAKHLIERLPAPLPLKLALGGLVVGVISIAQPQVWGNGYMTANQILNGQWLGYALLTLLLCKVLATAATVGSGAIGGVFTPTLFVGAAVGALAGQTLTHLAPSWAPPVSATTAVAMGAFLTATTQAPLTSILMIFEMTGTDQVILPLMLACVPAYAVVRLLRVESIYIAAHQRRSLEAAERDWATHSIAELVRPDPPCVHPEDSLATVAAAFATHRFQFLYVIDDAGQYLGAISLHDLRAWLDQHPDGMANLAQTLLHSNLPTLAPDLTVEAALTRFAQHRGERLPVIDAQGRIAGAVAKTDVMLELQERLRAHV
jgi:CIC family chloride channel protein